MQKSFNYLVFGATGFVGSEFIQHVLHKADTSKVMLVLRSKNGVSIQKRVEELKAQWCLLTHENLDFSKLSYLSLDAFFTSAEARSFMLQSNIIVLNALAETNMSFSLSELRVSNLFFLQKLFGWLKQNTFSGKFIHLSTAFVCGKSKGVILEEELGQSYNNFYEQSKAEAEIYLSHQQDVDFCILRPSIVLGRSTNGFYRGTKVIYSLLRLYVLDALKFIPIGGGKGVDCIPVDYLSEIIYRVAKSEESFHRACFHVVGGKANLLSTTQVFKRGSEIFEKHRGVVVPIFWAKVFTSKFLKLFIPHRLKEILELFSQHLPYLGSHEKFFDNTKLSTFLKDQYILPPKINVLVDGYLVFCKRTKWGKDLKAMKSSF